MKGRYLVKKAKLPFIKSIVVYVAWVLREQRQTFDWFLKNCKFK